MKEKNGFEKKTEFSVHSLLVFHSFLLYVKTAKIKPKINKGNFVFLTLSTKQTGQIDRTDRQTEREFI